MKKLEQFQCEFCHTIYREKSAAKECEKNHCSPIKILFCDYQAKGVNATGYPNRIDIEMSNGKIATYKR